MAQGLDHEQSGRHFRQHFLDRAELAYSVACFFVMEQSGELHPRLGMSRGPAAQLIGHSQGD